MNIQQILDATLTKAAKARKLYDLGYTRHQVADLICGGNYGWAHNIYAKHFGLEIRTRSLAIKFNKEFGVEIEAYGVDRNRLATLLNTAGIVTQVQAYNHNTTNVWKIVSDASVAGTNSFEIVSPILKGEKGLTEVQKVCEVLEAAGAKVNKSCGLHVHFNARNMTINDWKNLYKNYINLEPEIDSIMPISRRKNNNSYCKGLTYRYANKQSAFNAIDNCTTVSELSRSVTNNNRYYKLNAESYNRHGSVEFRQHSGTVEYKKISSWIKICSAMIDKSNTGIAGSLSDILSTELKSYICERKNKLRAA